MPIPQKYRLVNLVVLLAFAAVVLCCSGDGEPDTSTEDSETDSDSESESESGSEEEVTFDVTVSVSEKIGTVGIVEWTTSLESIDSAFIEFGLTEEYGMQAPSDLNMPEYRTLLLGMKPSREYNLRVVALRGESVYTSDNFTLETGPVSNFLPQLEIENVDSSELANGFIITSVIVNGWVCILDADGEYVWAYQVESESGACRARMSYDGQHMIVMTDEAIEQVDMDGYNTRIYDSLGATHDLVPLPDGVTGFIGTDGTYDKIWELNQDGSTTLVYDLTSFTDEVCHTNALRYDEVSDSYTISLLFRDTILKIDRSTGAVIWALNGANSSFEGTDWVEQHGHQLLPNGIILFNNNELEDSRVLEYELNETTFEATLVWEFENGNNSHLFGDVQRLPNGNTLVNYSFSGLLFEVNPQGNLLRSIQFLGSGSIGYSRWRESLYGPPNS